MTARIANSWRIASRAPGPVALERADDRGAEAARAHRRGRLGAQQHEAGRVVARRRRRCRVAIDPAAVEVGRPQGPDRRPGLVRRAHRADGVGRRVGRHDLGVRAGGAQEGLALGGGVRVRQHPRQPAGARASVAGDQVVAHGVHHLGPDPAGRRRRAASWSRVWLTEPSIEFSIGTSASGTSPSRTARKHSTTVGYGTPARRCRPQRAGGPPRRRCRAARGSRSSRRHAGGSGGRSGTRRSPRTVVGRRRRRLSGSRRRPRGAAGTGRPRASATARSSSGDSRCSGVALHHLLQVHAGVVAGVERRDHRARSGCRRAGRSTTTAARPCRGRRRSAPCPGSAARCAGSPR